MGVLDLKQWHSVIELHIKIYLQRVGASAFNVSYLDPKKYRRKHKFPDRPTPITYSPQKSPVRWASSWLRVKTLSINRSLILTPLLHTPRHTNPPNYFPLWSLSANQKLREESEVKNKHRLTSAGCSLCRRWSFHIRRSASQCQRVKSFDNATSHTAECVRMRWHHGSLNQCTLHFRSVSRVWAGGPELCSLMLLSRLLRLRAVAIVAAPCDQWSCVLSPHTPESNVAAHSFQWSCSLSAYAKKSFRILP